MTWKIDDIFPQGRWRFLSFEVLLERYGVDFERVGACGYEDL
jgi:hypothetical protein